MPFRILIADDHSIVRVGIKTIIKEHLPIAITDEVASEDEIIAAIRRSAYDAIILDINIPGTDFTNLMHWLKNNAPQTAVIIFSTYAEDIYSQKCFQLGAKGFIHKTASDAEIALTIRKILDGGTYLTEKQKVLAEQSAKSASKSNPFDHLSSRELEIALLIDNGHKLPEICSILNIQYSTANTYKRRIFEKLNIQTSVALSHLIQAFKITG